MNINKYIDLIIIVAIVICIFRMASCVEAIK